MLEFLVRLTQLAAPPYSPASVSHLHQISQVPLCITSIIATSPMPCILHRHQQYDIEVLNKMPHIFIHQMSLASGVYKTP